MHKHETIISTEDQAFSAVLGYYYYYGLSRVDVRG
jgi:hypothetical protein